MNKKGKQNQIAHSKLLSRERRGLKMNLGLQGRALQGSTQRSWDSSQGKSSRTKPPGKSSKNLSPYTPDLQEQRMPRCKGCRGSRELLGKDSQPHFTHSQTTHNMGATETHCFIHFDFFFKINSMLISILTHPTSLPILILITKIPVCSTRSSVV